MSYSVVVPCYKNYDELEKLTASIAETNSKYKPDELIIVNDANDDTIEHAAGLLSSELLPPISVINLQKHVGPKDAFAAGIEASTSEFVLLMHSDTLVQEQVNGRQFISVTKKKGVKKQVRFTIKLYDDPMSVLYSYINQVDDAAIVACHTIQTDNPPHIQGGQRALGRNGVPYSSLKGHLFDTLWLYGQASRREGWQRIFTCDNQFAILRKSDYDAVGGFSDDAPPYLYYWDDFCAKVRENNKHIYLTTDVVVEHPEYSQSIDGKKSKPKQDDFFYAVNWFNDKWKDHPIWSYNSLYKKLNVQDIGRDTIL